ncbi:hypothetical protein GE09DRAFT_1200741 [Coniochaeta sp. 2T2.1]|nr:hypothetical protein GE09DRAFT_1200741 [Coniochaeta sp. 2T2.1]
MNLPLVTSTLVLISSGKAAPTDDVEAIAYTAVIKLQKQYQRKIKASIKHRTTGCTEHTLLRRKEWGSLSKQDRLSYINAVYCLASKNSTTPLSQAPGAVSRYDDFVWSHIEQTPFVHNDGLFLRFHRQFVHLYEEALRSECGYEGAQPYWDSSISYADPRKSTVFDGSPWSMGSNGVYIPDRPNTTIPLPGGGALVFPPATGGGCMHSGPFTADKFQIHLGPIDTDPKGPQDGLGYNPRCLTRDLSLVYSNNCRPTNASALIAESKDLAAVNKELDTSPMGIHGAGHFVMDPVAMGVYSSPNDPAFWLHHANVDRLWAIWHGQDLHDRVHQVWGTRTSSNVPPSENVALDTQINFGVVGEPLVDVVSSVDGDLCYMYE